eukprot:GEMP01062173.1.p1 GENE.GEMP01062173.1~~GEMP01062173.1.p1  ORF type:complete len:299 (+),score=77.15 GEMP01062173.1:41-937(+)
MKRFLPKPYNPTEAFAGLEDNQADIRQHFKNNLHRRVNFRLARLASTEERFSQKGRPTLREMPKTRLEQPLHNGQFSWFRPDGWVFKDGRDAYSNKIIDSHPPKVSRSSSCPEGMDELMRVTTGDLDSQWARRKVAEAWKQHEMQSEKTPAQKRQVGPRASVTLGGGQSWRSRSTGALNGRMRSMAVERHEMDLWVEEEEDPRLKVDAAEVERLQKHMTMMGPRYTVFKKTYVPRVEKVIEIPMRTNYMDPLKLWKQMEADAPQKWLRCRQIGNPTKAASEQNKGASVPGATDEIATV